MSGRWTIIFGSRCYQAKYIVEVQAQFADPAVHLPHIPSAADMCQQLTLTDRQRQRTTRPQPPSEPSS